MVIYSFSEKFYITKFASFHITIILVNASLYFSYGICQCP